MLPPPCEIDENGPCDPKSAGLRARDEPPPGTELGGGIAELVELFPDFDPPIAGAVIFVPDVCTLRGGGICDDRDRVTLPELFMAGDGETSDATLA